MNIEAIQFGISILRKGILNEALKIPVGSLLCGGDWNIIFS